MGIFEIAYWAAIVVEMEILNWHFYMSRVKRTASCPSPELFS